MHLGPALCASRAVNWRRMLARDCAGTAATSIGVSGPRFLVQPHQTIGEIIGRPIRLFRPDIYLDTEVSAGLEQVRLAPRAGRRYPDELSGGDAKGGALVRASAARPQSAPVDEVTSAPDGPVQATILELIAELNARLATTVVSRTTWPSLAPLVGGWWS